MVKYLLKNIRNILTKEQPDILSASVTMMLLSLVTKVLGLLTKVVAVPQLGAEKFGLFVAANTVPEVISTLLIFGTITSVILPILVKVKEEEGKDSFTKLFGSIVNVGLIIFILAMVVIGVFAGRFTPFFLEKIAEPTDPYSQEDIRQIVNMMRLLLIPQVILGISSLLTSALNALKRFIIPQLAPIFYNIGILFGSFFLIPFFDGSPMGLVVGVLIGSVLHLIVQLPLGFHLKLNYSFSLNFFNKDVRNVLIIALPRIVANAADQLAKAIDRGIAAGIGAASLGAYYLAVTIVTVPYSLFTNTFSLAALPHLSSAYARNDLVEFKAIFSEVFNQILFLTVPVTMIFMVLRLPLVRLFYGLLGESFTWENTLMVAWVVFFFSLGLVPEVLWFFLNRTFYAIHDTVRPLLVGLFVVIGGVVTGILFTNYFSNFNTFSILQLHWNWDYFINKADGISAVGGLALSSSLIYTLSFFFLFILLLNKIGGLKKSFWISTVRKSLGGIVMAVFMYWAFKSWNEVLDTARTINVFILTLSTIIPGASLYLWLMYILKDPEITIVYSFLKAIKKVFHKVA